MKRYCINDFLDLKYGFITYSRQEKFKDKYIQIQDLTDAEVMKLGDKFARILVFSNESDTDAEYEIPLIAPQNGFYIIDIYHILNRTKNMDISKDVFRCYEEVNEGVILVADEDFADQYNELFENLSIYYSHFVEAIQSKRKFFYLGKCDYSIGAPETETPTDFLSLVDSVLQSRKSQSVRKTVQQLHTISNMIDCASMQYCTRMQLYISRKKISINNELVDFTDIAYIDKARYLIDKNGKCIERIGDDVSKQIIINIIEANKIGDYSHILCNDLWNVDRCYSLCDLMGNDNEWKSYDSLKLTLANPYDVEFNDYINGLHRETSHYYLSDEPIVTLSNQYKKMTLRTKCTGYYSFEVPSFFSPLFIDIPFIVYRQSSTYQKLRKMSHGVSRTFKYTIEQDRFTKEKTIKWIGADNMQILPNDWYEFRVSLNYIKNEPTIIMGIKNVYSKRAIEDESKIIDGRLYKFYLLLVNGESFEYSKSKYRKTYVGQNGYCIWVEYSLDKREIYSFLNNAIEAVRIVVPEGDVYEYETEPFLYDDFRNYVKLYYNAIVECDPTFKHDIGAGALAETQNCFVYMMRDLANGYYKIGISNNPEYRERTLQSEKPTIELIKAKEFPVRAIAEAFEAALHKTYAAKRLRGEWFNLDVNDVDNLIKSLS